MRSAKLIANLVRGLLFAGAITAGVSTVAFAAVPQRPDPASANRLVVPVSTSATSEPVVQGTRLGKEAMVYRFRAQANDSSLRATATPDAWEVTVYATATDGGPFRVLARLSPRLADVALPYPYGYTLAATESLVLVVRIIDGSKAPSSITVTVDYEPVQATSGRRGVLLHAAHRVEPHATAPAGGRAREWEWTPTVSGRMLFVTGTYFATAHEIVISDAETGEVLRRIAPAGRAQAGADSADVTVLRTATHVRAGRLYRVTAYYTSDNGSADAAGANGVVQALVVPGT